MPNYGPYIREWEMFSFTSSGSQRPRIPNGEGYASTLGPLGIGAASMDIRRCDHTPAAMPTKLAMKLRSPAAKRIKVPNEHPPFTAAPRPNSRPPTIVKGLGE